MAQVHTFPLLTSLFSDTRLAGQYPGDGADPEPFQVELGELLAFFAADLAAATPAVTVSNGDTVAVAAGRLIFCIAIEAPSGDRTVKVGTTAGADDIMELTDITNGQDFTYTLNFYTSTSKTLHFTTTGGTISVLVFTKAKA